MTTGISSLHLPGSNLPNEDFLGRPPLPPVRKIFIPDPGYVIVDADQDGAEARYVAWEAGGAYKAAFLSGIKIHIETMQEFFHDKWLLDPKYEPFYTKCKNMAYGTTYGGGARGIAAAAAIQESIVAAFQPWFLGRYPGIADWHHRTEVELFTNRRACNHFGYRIAYFDRPQGLLPKALAWQPQSSIAIVTQRGQELIAEEFEPLGAQLLLQVHDSVIFQVPVSKLDLLPKIRARLCSAEQLAIPFPSDPLLIPWSFKASRKSWGDCLPLDCETLRVQTGLDAEKKPIWEAL